MSSSINRTLETARLLASSSDEASLKKELMLKWGLKERQVKRIIADAYIIDEWKRTEIAALHDAEKKEVWAKVAEKNLPGIMAMIAKLVAMANAEYVTETTIHTPDGFKTMKVSPTIKEELMAMTKLKEYKELFTAIMENHTRTFLNMTEMLTEFKKEEIHVPNKVAIVK